MNVAYLGWCPTQTAYTAYSIVHIHRPGRKGTLASDLKGAGLEFDAMIRYQHSFLCINVEFLYLCVLTWSSLVCVLNTTY